MRLLLDTHILIWWLQDDRALPPVLKQRIIDRHSMIFVSVASVWEIAIKVAIGRLDFPINNIRALLGENEFDLLPISLDHAVRIGSLPHYHRNPFDRMLVAQACEEGLTIVTTDPQIRRYPVPVLDADAR